MDRCLAIGCKRSTKSTAVAWQQHYRRVHKINLEHHTDLETLRMVLQPWHAPDFEMNADWGYYLTKKSPIHEFEHLSVYWQATSDPLTFRRSYHDNVLKQYRTLFTRVFQATPISFHAHASDTWPLVPHIAAALEDNAPVHSTGLTKKQKKCHLIATFEAQMVSYHGALV